MRIKLILLILVLASLACTTSVTVLNPAATVIATTPPVGVPPLEGLPIVIPPDIASLHMLDTQNGWMTTDRFVLRTMDGGTTWHDVTPRGVYAVGFGAGTSFLDSNRGWVLIADANDPVNAGTLYSTRDGGIQWESHPVPFGSGELHFLDNQNGWMMLNAGAGAGNMAVKFFQTTDGGTNWTQVFTNVPTDAQANNSLPTAGIKSGFTPLSMQEAWVTGQVAAPNTVYLYHTTDGARTWTLVDPGLPFSGEAMYLTQPPVFFGSQIGLLPTMAGSEGSGTFFFVTQDGGSTWTAGAGLPGSGQSSVVSPNDVFVLFSGVLFISHDVTQTWISLTPDVDLNTNTIVAFQFVDPQTGWIGRSDANGHTSLYKTIDGGQTWTAQIQ